MEKSSNTVGPLKKVSLHFTAGKTSGSYDLISTPQPFEFIFGIASDGLTQFECALDGKQTGDEGVIEVEQKNLAEIFGHIFSCAFPFPVNSEHLYLHYTITGISNAAPNEVVKSMAAISGGGCGGSCGCGCGSD